MIRSGDWRKRSSRSLEKNDSQLVVFGIAVPGPSGEIDIHEIVFALIVGTADRQHRHV